MIRISQSKPIRRLVRIQVDNRVPADFVMTLHPSGTIEFREKGRRSSVSLSVQSAFNRARLDSAADVIKKQRSVRKVKRGLLALGRLGKALRIRKPDR